MNNKISDELIQEQDAIINSNDSKIVVSAGPGSGKTHTIIQKAIRELKEFESSKINRGIILCSFTREVSLELNKRLSKEIKNEFSFVGTIDSFIFAKIINPFKNRILKKIRSNFQIVKDKIKVSFPDSDKNAIVNKLTIEGLNTLNKSKVKEYYNNWVDNLVNGKYEISFAAYLFAGDAIEITPELKKYCEDRYHSIYIDEAQDLNFFQINFIKKIINSININCYLIGDKRQSIYNFRGAKPELFYSMINEGFREFKITHSARCHYNILEYSRRIVGESNNRNKLKNNNRVITKYSINDNLDFLRNIDNYFILVETNYEANNIYNKCVEKGIENIIYSKKIVLDGDKEFSENYHDIIEEILKFFYNHNNVVPQLAYSIEELSLFLESIIDRRKLNINNLLIKENEKAIDYLKKVLLLGEIKIPNNMVVMIEEQLNQKEYVNQYTKYENVNRIMTIHSSKGLEAKYVFLQFLRKRFQITEELKRKLFVAFTRAKDHLVIGFNGDLTSPMEEYINSIFSSTFI